MHTIQSGTTQAQHQETLVALKSYFMTLISHELRTPLTTILSSADLLECYSNSWSDEKKLKHVQKIQTAALEMTKLIESEQFTETLRKVASEIH
jgi:K+-sensing histidine kinase KdpD